MYKLERRGEGYSATDDVTGGALKPSLVRGKETRDGVLSQDGGVQDTTPANDAAERREDHPDAVD